MKPILLLALAACTALQADVKVPALISDHMLLQQQSPVRIWGWADPGESVTVSFAGQKVSGTAGQDGRWALFLKPLKPGASGSMTIAGKNTITVEDVLVGDVWVGSGQSNMGFTVGRSDNAEKEIATAKYASIRLFSVKLQVADQPAEDTTGKWVLCSPDTIKNFSAVLYFFGRELHLKRKIPVGLINSSWGGTPVQSWTTRPTMENDASLKFILDDWATVLERYPAARQKYDAQLEAWKKAAAEAKAAGKTPPTAPRPPSGPGHQNTPGGLYNAMIAPLVSYAIKGAVWYQGESNANPNQAVAYRKMFRAMIEDWRREWGIGPFPFGFVQLANYKSNGWWPLLRESQSETLNVRNTGQAVTIDIGNPTDIHPTNKQDVGKRLGLWARATVYGEKIEYSGPVYRTAAVEGNKMRLWFDHAGLGLAARGGGKLEGFIIAGKDGNFVPAEAKVEGETLVVSSDQVAEPAAVRYGWEDSPTCNFVNKDGIPASPFRTDVKALK